MTLRFLSDRRSTVQSGQSERPEYAVRVSTLSMLPSAAHNALSIHWRSRFHVVCPGHSIDRSPPSQTAAQSNGRSTGCLTRSGGQLMSARSSRRDAPVLGRIEPRSGETPRLQTRPSSRRGWQRPRTAVFATRLVPVGSAVRPSIAAPACSRPKDRQRAPVSGRVKRGAPHHRSSHPLRQVYGSADGKRRGGRLLARICEHRHRPGWIVQSARISGQPRRRKRHRREQARDSLSAPDFWPWLLSREFGAQYEEGTAS